MNMNLFVLSWALGCRSEACSNRTNFDFPLPGLPLGEGFLLETLAPFKRNSKARASGSKTQDASRKLHILYHIISYYQVYGQKCWCETLIAGIFHQKNKLMSSTSSKRLKLSVWGWWMQIMYHQPPAVSSPRNNLDFLVIAASVLEIGVEVWDWDGPLKSSLLDASKHISCNRSYNIAQTDLPM